MLKLLIIDAFLPMIDRTFAFCQSEMSEIHPDNFVGKIGKVGKIGYNTQNPTFSVTDGS